MAERVEANTDSAEPTISAQKDNKPRSKKKKPRKSPRERGPMADEFHQAHDDVVIEEEVVVTGSSSITATGSVEQQEKPTNRSKKKKPDRRDSREERFTGGRQNDHQGARDHMSYSQLRGNYRQGGSGGHDRGYQGHRGHQRGQGHNFHQNFNMEYQQPYCNDAHGYYHNYEPQGAEFMRGQGRHMGHNAPRGQGQGRPRSGSNRSEGQMRGQPPGGQEQGRTEERGSGPTPGRDPPSDKKKRHNNKKQMTPKQVFEPYWDMEKVQQGLKRGELIQGKIRINPKNFEDAYIAHPDGKSDIYLSGLSARNRALEADVVVVQLSKREDWKVLMDEVEYGEKALAARLGSLKLSSKDEDGSSERTANEASASSTDANDANASSSASNTAEKDVESVPDSVKKDGAKTASQDTKDKHSGKEMSENPNGSKTPGSAKKGSNYTPRKRYTSLQDMVLSPSAVSSPAVKRLFDDSYDGRPAGNPTVTESDRKVMEAVPDKYLLRTGKVVYIVEKVHSRAFTGHVKLMNDKNKDRALFCPTDHRMPRLFVPMSQCPPDFYERSEDYGNTLFVGRMTDWRDNSQFADGNLAKSLGEAGEIEPETEGMLIAYGIDFAEFPEQAIACLPQVSPESPWKIPEREYQTRRDLRQECIFTIDPATARDLDDALHCKSLGNGLYEVGVHIADVSYFVEFASFLDEVARSRSTSVYLVQRVIPMLPRLLCEKLCSLNPDEDRLTFSVIWKLNEKGGVVDEWFGRTIIRSCVKLSYDHAQGFINEPERQWQPEELPVISKGFSIPMIVEKVLNLHKIAQNLRKRRFDEGALRLDQVKLEYTLDKETGLPNGYKVYRQRQSNKLVEEFMLLANMAVAHHIYKYSPELALLRRHPPPQEKMINDLELQCEHLGVSLNCSSAGSIHDSIAALAGDDLDTQARQQILVVLCSKPMQNALYFCTGCLEDEELYRHYALNVPLYTHFTSPIRRYPDIMVHRLLAASLGYCDPPALKKNEAEYQADHSNRKKNDSKKVQDRSCELYFAAFVKACGPLEEQGMVMGVLDKAIDVLILSLGVVKRVYMEQLPLRDFSFSKHQKTPKLNLMWAASETHRNERRQFLTIFSRVNCVLCADEKISLKWNASIKHPDEE